MTIYSKLADFASLFKLKKAWILFFRSFFIQAYWNREGLQNIGFAFTILPFLTKIYSKNSEKLNAAITRHLDYFVTNPYLVPLVAALVIDKEESSLTSERNMDKEIPMIKKYLSSSLAAIGDSFIWGCLRPFNSIIGCMLFFVCFKNITSNYIVLSIILYLLLYNSVTLNVRFLCGAAGIRYKEAVLQYLKKIPLAKIHHVLCLIGLAITSFLILFFIICNVPTVKLKLFSALFLILFVSLKILEQSTIKIFISGLVLCVILTAIGLL
ncbi:MAG: PTS system mannose/fructose/sorbose family transporter subunit IID [bacterium]